MNFMRICKFMDSTNFISNFFVKSLLSLMGIAIVVAIVYTLAKSISNSHNRKSPLNSTKKYCPSCGNTLPSESKFCPQCGKSSAYPLVSADSRIAPLLRSNAVLEKISSAETSYGNDVKDLSKSSQNQSSNESHEKSSKTVYLCELSNPLNESIAAFKKTRNKDKKNLAALEIVNYCKTISNKNMYDSNLNKNKVEEIRSQYQSFLNCGLLQTKDITPTTQNKINKFKSYGGYVVFDVETTGLSVYSEKIIEIALLKIHPQKEPEKYSTFVNPQRPLSDFIKNLTGINDSDLASAPIFSEISDEIISFIDGLPLVAHNASFDINFLEHELKRDYAFLYADTLKMARICFPFFSNHKLKTLIKELNLGDAQDHRALSDVFYTHLVFEKCMKIIPSDTFPPVPEKHQKIQLAGSYYYDTTGIKIGKAVDLVPEPENLHDKNAVSVDWHDKTIGYIPAREVFDVYHNLIKEYYIKAEISDIDSNIIFIKLSYYPRKSIDEIEKSSVEL